MIKLWASVNEWKNNAEEMRFTGNTRAWYICMCSAVGAGQ